MAGFDPATDPEVIALFATEAAERLLRLSSLLADLGRGEPAALEAGRIEAHTLKGGAAMMGFAELSECARRVEALLSAGSTGPGPDPAAVATELIELTRLVADATSPPPPTSAAET